MTWLPANSTNSGLLTFLSLVSQYYGHSYDNLFTETYENVSEMQNEYDFIIVGAGSAGCVVANRLSEESKWKILLLEGGDEEPIVADVPGMLSFLPRSSIDYNYFTLPEPVGAEATDRKVYNLPRGKVMGGSSTINAMFYLRGSTEDYNDWAKFGNEGWSWDDVLPYFKKSEDARDLEIYARNPTFHGRGGYLTIETLHNEDQHIPAFIEAWKEFGMREIDFNTGSEQLGFGRSQFHRAQGARMSSNGAFIRPIRSTRKNLFIKTKARATKIIIDEKTKRAIGVEYEVTDGKNILTKKAYVTKEVVVSAGAIDSPKLLMLSGIGPRQDLQNLNITAIHDLPVGHNLHNHIQASSIDFEIETNSTTVSPETMWNDFIYWMSAREGRWTTHELLSITGYQTQFEKRPGVADIHLVVRSNDKNSSLDISGPYYGSTRVLTVYSTLLDPHSRGYVKLNKDDPSGGKPEIRMNYLTHPRDIKVLLEGLKFARKLDNAKALKNWGFKFLKEAKAGCEEFVFESDSYLECIIKKYLAPLNHSAGTCKMGPKTDNSSVVDSELKVHGIKGLRVVDASIMPHITKCNTYGPTVMIGEKGSDMIKSSWL